MSDKPTVEQLEELSAKADKDLNTIDLDYSYNHDFAVSLMDFWRSGGAELVRCGLKFRAPRESEEGLTPRVDALEYCGYRWNMDCAYIFRLARQLERELITKDYFPDTRQSISELIPKWYEGGTVEQMLGEAFAQILTLETALRSRSGRT